MSAGQKIVILGLALWFAVAAVELGGVLGLYKISPGLGKAEMITIFAGFILMVLGLAMLYAEIEFKLEEVKLMVKAYADRKEQD